MYIDSHCHLDFPQLARDVPHILQEMRKHHVSHALVVSVCMPDWPQLINLVHAHPNLYASVGVHPDYPDTPEPSCAELVQMAQTPKVIAIGETGLDYFRQSEPLDWQRARFRTHIQAARQAKRPLIIHTRAAAEDTLRLMREEHAQDCSGVMHCFSESWEVAQGALDLGFYISFSGIVTFKNAQALQDVARRVPLDRILIETDAPYLAPVPFRGQRNDPSKVVYVAEKIAELRHLSAQVVGEISSRNFQTLFKLDLAREASGKPE